MSTPEAAPEPESTPLTIWAAAHDLPVVRRGVILPDTREAAARAWAVEQEPAPPLAEPGANSGPEALPPAPSGC
ncbi:hypothetical protein [Kitasatospora sp. SUK 42]|uniref:hypothetical protein n=1 Tax=Kitasatospora sp. SUK 42 TaxID=1588882 RepID=UPI0018CA9C34|nr:hypothetical protein [Kitasatospora sp. SUK 42]MBV2153277.1 hypothetical protein [Kitasatospora sp. SUK 42]